MRAKTSELNVKLKNQKYFGELVVRLRKEKQITPAELARRCLFDRSNLARIERGDRNVSLDVIIRLANGLGITPSQLLEGFK